MKNTKKLLMIFCSVVVLLATVFAIVSTAVVAGENTTVNEYANMKITASHGFEDGTYKSLFGNIVNGGIPLNGGIYTTDNGIRKAAASIYGDDSAYVSFLRTGIARGYQNMSFYKMEGLYCAYLVTKKRLTSLAEEIPSYTELCDKLKHIYACYGRKGVENYVHGTPEEYLILNLLKEADKEALEICKDEQKSKSDCFKPAGSLNYMFTKIFPVKPGQLSDSDRKQAARFRKELRDRGMDEIANAMFAAMNQS